MVSTSPENHERDSLNEHIWIGDRAVGGLMQLAVNWGSGA